MRARLRHLVAFSIVTVTGALAACSSDDSAPGTTAGITAGEYKGEISGKNETGVLDIALSGGSLATSSLAILDDATSQATVSGTLALDNGVTLQVTGTYDPSTGALALSAGGYTFTGSASGGTISGTYSGPNGSGSFTLIQGSGAQIFCGSYSGPDNGVWNLAIGPTSAGGSVANRSGTYASPMTCTVAGGTDLSCTANEGVSAKGTVSGTTASGTWSDGSGHSGTWTGTTGACPVPATAGPDAGQPDATVSDDGGGSDGSSGPDANGDDASSDTDGATAEDAGKDANGGGTDAAGAQDSAAGNEGGAQLDAGAHDSGSDTGTTSDAGADDAGAHDAATPSDSSTPTDASTPTDSSAPTDADIVDSAEPDTGPVDAAACPYSPNLVSVTTNVMPTVITSLGSGTGLYPVFINASISICPGITTVQVSHAANPNTWTTIGTCTGKGAGPNTDCRSINIPAADLTTSGDVITLRAVNPGMPAGTGFSIDVVHGNPSPVILQGTPSGNLVVGGGAQSITFTGSGFSDLFTTVEGDFTQDGGLEVTPTISNLTSTSMTVTFSAAFCSVAEPQFLTRVINPGPGGGSYYWVQSLDVQ